MSVPKTAVVVGMSNFRSQRHSQQF